VGHLRPFRLPGGDAAAREPRRSAIAVLCETFGDEVFARDDIASLRQFSKSELGVLRTVLTRGVNAPWTTSAGRLFDAVASLLDLRQVSRFEGDAALAVQFAATGWEDALPYPFAISAGGEIDWRPMIQALLREPLAAAARFHVTLAGMIAQLASRSSEPCVVLCGGCFQNRVLLEATVKRLEAAGHDVFWPQQVPANDGGLALGQIAAASWQLKQRER
jgi:hydrogenase maturation protein HypF